MAQTRNFTILERNAQEQVREFEPGTIEYTYVASAVNIALSILSMPHARQCLADLAIEFDKTQREAWYPRLHGVIENPASLVDSFLTKVRDNTPMMVVDHTITHIDILAYHPRGQWDQEFIPRKQAVNLNARVFLLSHIYVYHPLTNFSAYRTWWMLAKGVQHKTSASSSSNLPTRSSMRWAGTS